MSTRILKKFARFNFLGNPNAEMATPVPLAEAAVPIARADGASWASVLLYANLLTLAGSGFFFWLIAARRFDEIVLGRGSVFSGGLVLVAALSLLGRELTIVSILPRLGAIERRNFIAKSMSLVVLVSVVLSAIWVGVLGARHEFPAVWQDPAIYALFVVIAGTWTASLLLDAVLTGIRANGWLVLKNGVYGLLRILALLVFPGTSVLTILSAWGLPLLLMTAVTAFAVSKSAAMNFSTVERDTPALKTKNFANFLWGALLFIPETMGPLIVMSRWGISAAGTYYLLWMVGALALMGPRVLSRSLLVEFSSGASLNIRTYLKAAALVGGTAVLVLSVGVVFLYITGKFPLRESIQSLALFALGIPFALVFFIQAARLRHEDRTIEFVGSAGLMAFTYITLLRFAPWPPEWAGALMTISLIVSLSVMYVMNRTKRSPEEISLCAIQVSR